MPKTHLASAPLSRGLIAFLIVFAALSIALPAWIAATVHYVPPPAAKLAKARVQRVAPKTVIPEVDPVQLVDLTPGDARQFNAQIPFSTAPNPAARAFHIFGEAADRERAIDCLAAAVVYEAGDDATGEQAVAQVILNRVRHPAFPKSVCGVVFQGAERSTGCQFTFTCDGAMLRWSPTPAAWERARYIARAALTGQVDKRVGHATHYHTDWVVPYWSSSLEKIVAVKTHLFFRWAGWWGTPPAFDRRYTGAEPVIAQLGRLSPAHAGGELPPEEAATDLPEGEGVAEATSPDANTFLVTLDRSLNAEAFAALAIRSCGDRQFCKFMGWTDPKLTPKSLPLSDAALNAMAFSYLRDTTQGYGKALWNCDLFPRPSPVQCMRRGTVRTPAVVTIPAQPERKPAAKEEAPLSGVRRKSEADLKSLSGFTLAAPAPAASATPAGGR